MYISLLNENYYYYYKISIKIFNLFLHTKSQFLKTKLFTI